MHGKGAECTASKTTPAGSERKLYLVDCGYVFLIARVGEAHIRQVINCVEFLCGKGRGGLILKHIDLAVLLCQSFATNRVLFPLLYCKCFCVFTLVCTNDIHTRQFYAVDVIYIRYRHTSSAYILDIVNVLTVCEPVCDFNDCAFTHAVDEYIGARVYKNAVFHRIRPIIVVGEPAKACFYAADYDRDSLKGLLYTVAVHNGRPVGTLACDSTLSVGIITPALFCRGVVIHHGIYVACGNEKSESRPAKHFKLCG